MSVAVSTPKGHWIKFSHRIASISVKVVWTTWLPICEKFLCCFFNLQYIMEPLFEQIGWVKECSGTLLQTCLTPSSPHPSSFLHCLLQVTVAFRHLNWRHLPEGRQHAPGAGDEKWSCHWVVTVRFQEWDVAVSTGTRQPVFCPALCK